MWQIVDVKGIFTTGLSWRPEHFTCLILQIWLHCKHFASPLAFVLSGGQQQCLDLIRTINVIICHEQQENAQSLPFIDDKSRKNALTPFCEQRMHKDPVALRMNKQKTLSEECTVSALWMFALGVDECVRTSVNPYSLSENTSDRWSKALKH